MCGIVGAIAERNVSAILLEALSVLNTVAMIALASLFTASNISCNAYVAPAKSPNWLTPLSNNHCPATLELPTPAGPHMARPVKPMPIRISLAKSWR